MSESKKTNGGVNVIKREERASLRNVNKAVTPKKKGPAEIARDVNSTVEGWVREFKLRRDLKSASAASLINGSFSEGEIAA